MRLLVINFEMDPASQVLAWQLSVVRELAALCDEVVVLTHRTTDTQLPDNVSVHVFPKTLQRAPLRWIGGNWWMNWYVWRLCQAHSIDACFVHMNMRWAYRLAPVFRLSGIPVLLWYAHGTVTRQLKLAHWCVNGVVTSTPEGLRLRSRKTAVIGQGIDTSLFALTQFDSGATDILTVGRISRRKRLDLMVDVMDALWTLEPDAAFRLLIVGGPLTAADREYHKTLEARVARCLSPQNIKLLGPLPVTSIPPLYQSTFVHLNLSQTGSMDKTVVEALAIGSQVLTSNEAFREILSNLPQMIVANESPAAIAEQILTCYRLQHVIDRAALRALVVGRHDLATYGVRIVKELQLLQNRA